MVYYMHLSVPQRTHSYFSDIYHLFIITIIIIVIILTTMKIHLFF